MSASMGGTEPSVGLTPVRLEPSLSPDRGGLAVGICALTSPFGWLAVASNDGNTHTTKPENTSMHLYDPVHAGDLISASRMNDMISKLAELEKRLESLESGDGNRIDRIEPVEGQHLGRRIRIRGSDFLYPPERNTVNIVVPSESTGNGDYSVRVTDFVDAGSGTRVITADLPMALRGPLSQQLPVYVEVTSRARVDSRAYVVRPPIATTVPNPSIDSNNYGARIGLETAGSDGNTTLQFPIVFGREAVVLGSNFANSTDDIRTRFEVRIENNWSELPNVVVKDAHSSRLVLTIPPLPKAAPWSKLEPNDVATFRLHIEVPGAANPAVGQGRIRVPQ